ncbi:class I SAM-dependent methyltransferase [Acutalibacter caecimuris]|uniref:class I SAM-dependent methyltransferase n=1 Tax=Acutalibacter caecimuris TaxID=3093657 RepID=UPI002AC8E106|nr:class I SAM-dependent methyltransferase [Acutalibacter sp. M00118]
MATSSRPLYTLSPRLAACAALVRPGRAMIDVGTDHAYLPIWLLKTESICRAVACDINPGPLDTAFRHAQRYQVQEKLRLVLSDGLRELTSKDGDDIVIAGMGGELILRIIQETSWLLSPEKRLILQPMSMVGPLRLGLAKLGFQVQDESAVIDAGKVYSAFSAEYTGKEIPVNHLYPYMGQLQPGSFTAKQYAHKTLRGIRGLLQGAEHTGDLQTVRELRKIIDEITKKYILPGDNYGENL